MKKISLKGISEILSEKELKNVMGGSGSDGCTKNFACCTKNGSKGICTNPPVGLGLYCSTANGGAGCS